MKAQYLAQPNICEMCLAATRAGMRKLGPAAEGNLPCGVIYSLFTKIFEQRLVGTERNVRPFGKAERNAENARSSFSQKIFAKQIFFANGCGENDSVI